MKIIKCQECGVKIKSAEDIDYVEDGSIFYAVGLDKDGYLSYEQKDTRTYEAGEFICATLPFTSDEDVRKDLVNLKKSK
jgi:hypothetical protein